MQTSIGGTYQQTGSAPDDDLGHPERMLFYALIGSSIAWSVIGIFSWVIWKLIG